MSSDIEQVEIDFMLLADRAEVLNGKVYMMGGAWDRRFINDIAAPIGLSIVIGVLVPWNLTNETHSLDINIVDEDGTVISPIPNVQLKVGRPANSTKGQTFRATAVLSNNWTLPKFGAYDVVASISGRAAKKVTFYADQARKPANAPQ